MENLGPPPPPQLKDGKMARFCPSRAFILDLGGDGRLLFHFILSKAVGVKEFQRFVWQFIYFHASMRKRIN